MHVTLLLDSVLISKKCTNFDDKAFAVLTVVPKQSANRSAGLVIQPIQTAIK